MKTACLLMAQPRMTLEADTAAELMTPSPVSVRLHASVHEAMALMIDQNFDAAPVIDETGRPVGVVTVSDILIHDREYARYLKTGDTKAPCSSRCNGHRALSELGIDVIERVRVDAIMTPIVFTVHRDLPSREAVRRMIELNVHHLFVTDDEGTIIGVISSGDVLRRLA